MVRMWRRWLAALAALLILCCPLFADAMAEDALVGTFAERVVSALLPEEAEALAEGSEGEAVSALQQRLAELGFLDERPDGVYGRHTALAVEAFQRVAGLDETGKADVDTLELLYSEEAEGLEPETGPMVWIPRTGKRYHSRERCSGMKKPSLVTVDEARRRGFTPCKRCYS